MSGWRNALLPGVTAEGYLLLGVAICPAQAHEAILRLPERFSALQLTVTGDPFDIDHQLAIFAAGLFPPGVPAAGFCMRIAHHPGPTGGVIGNPHRQSASAAGVSAAFDGVFSCAALPGGPGFVIEGTPELAARLLASVSPGAGGAEVLKMLARRAAKMDIPRLIAISDGTGANMPGSAASLEDGRLQIGVLLERKVRITNTRIR